MEKFEQKNDRLEHKRELAEKEFEISRAAFEKLLKQLMPALKEHKYNIVIGDDASGRVPTLIFGGLIREINQQDKLEPPKVLFFAAGRRESKRSQKKVKQGITKHLLGLEKGGEINPEKSRTLIVTEHMDTGKSLEYLAEAVKAAGLSCDAASLTSELNIEDYKFNKSKKLQGSKLYIGEQKEWTPPFYGKRNLSGVIKKEKRVKFFRKAKIFSEPVRGRGIKETREENVKDMIDYLFRLYES